MQKFQLIVLFIVFGYINLNAQNWKLLNEGNKYNYQIDTADYITNTIFIEYVDVINEDSVFFLNRIMTYCDTCPPSPYPELENYYALKNQPQFLMRKMVKESDSLYIFQDTIDFSIRPLADIGETWLFDVDNSIQAEITYKREEDVFGQTDSVKHISLSNNKTIIISKNFGILQFPSLSENYYQLLGIEGAREIGETLPDFWDFLNYEVGDILQDYEYDYSFYPGGSERKTYRKYEIASKEISGNSVTYNIEGTFSYSFNFDPVLFDYFSSTLQYINLDSHLTNRYPNEIINIDPTYWCFENYGFKKNVEITNINGRYVKKVGSMTEFFPYYGYDQEIDDLLIKYPEYCEYYKVELKYTEGLGICKKSQSSDYYDTDDGNYYYMTGRIHNGDTIGWVYPDEYYDIDHLPVASNVVIVGEPFIGITLHASYTYSDEDSDAEGNSSYRWYIANDSSGTTGLQSIQGANDTTYTVTSAELGKCLMFQVTPYSGSPSYKFGDRVRSDFTDEVTENFAPTASNIEIIGDLMVGKTLHGTYTFSDEDGDLEGQSLYQWYTDDYENHSHVVKLINDANDLSYTLTSEELGKSIKFEVIPVQEKGNFSGNANISESTDIVIPINNSFFAIPNIVKDKIRIFNLDTYENVRIFDSNGVMVFEFSPEDNNEIDLSFLRLGLYLIVSEKNDEKEIVKFIKI